MQTFLPSLLSDVLVECPFCQARLADLCMFYNSVQLVGACIGLLVGLKG